MIVVIDSFANCGGTAASADAVVDGVHLIGVVGVTADVDEDAGSANTVRGRVAQAVVWEWMVHMLWCVVMVVVLELLLLLLLVTLVVHGRLLVRHRKLRRDHAA